MCRNKVSHIHCELDHAVQDPKSSHTGLEMGKTKWRQCKARLQGRNGKNHVNFEILPAGLLVSTKYPFLGATPDGLVSCSCCDIGLLEVKCPYKYRDSDPHDINDTSFYLQRESDGTMMLNQDHDYYFQGQGQMAIWNRKYCDFVCWTTKGYVVIRIQYDDAFLMALWANASSFFTITFYLNL